MAHEANTASANGAVASRPKTTRTPSVSRAAHTHRGRSGHASNSGRSTPPARIRAAVVEPAEVPTITSASVWSTGRSPADNRPAITTPGRYRQGRRGVATPGTGHGVERRRQAAQDRLPLRRQRRPEDPPQVVPRWEPGPTTCPGAGRSGLVGGSCSRESADLLGSGPRDLSLTPRSPDRPRSG